jgi:hypothetical protein
MQLFVAFPMTPSVAVADFGAREIADLSPSTFSYPWQLPSSMASLFLSPAINLLLESLSPAINCSSVINCSLVSMTPAITENPGQRLIAGVNDTGDKFFVGFIDTAGQFNTGVVDTGDKH